MNTSHLFDFILAEFEIVCESAPEPTADEAGQWLLERYRAGETAVPSGRAQNLSYPVLEEIRMLANLRHPRKTCNCLSVSRNWKKN
jgi:hypothetical protein